MRDFLNDRACPAKYPSKDRIHGQCYHIDPRTGERTVMERGEVKGKWGGRPTCSGARPKHWPAADDAYLLRANNEHVSQNAMARALGCKQGTVRRRLIALGLVKP